MLSWALVFLVIALIAAALGFGGVAGTAGFVCRIPRAIPRFVDIRLYAAPAGLKMPIAQTLNA